MFTDDTDVSYRLGTIDTLRQGGDTDGTDTTNWLGPIRADTYSGVNETTYGAHSGDPSIAVLTCRMPLAAAIDGYVERVDMVLQVSHADLAGTFHLWKFHFTDASTTVTATDIGTIATVTAAGSTTQARTFSITPGPTATVLAGDLLLVLYKGTGSAAANYYYHVTTVIRGT
jgi:hypothetical protein